MACNEGATAPLPTGGRTRNKKMNVSPVNECKTIQILEPDSTLLVASQSGSIDQALDERGEVILSTNQVEVTVNFLTQKLSDEYRYEYLYVDALGLANPGTIVPVPIRETVAGFTVVLAGEPPQDGYILRWRVVVESTQLGGTVTLPVHDSPEVIYEQIPSGSLIFQVIFTSPRSTQTYGFSELRIENLIDLPGEQTPILAQVVAKTVDSFTVALSPSPQNNNYYLAARTP